MKARAVGDGDEIASALLVRLGPPDSDVQSFGGLLEVVHVESYKLGSPQCSGKTEEQQGTVTQPTGIRGYLANDRPDGLCGRRCLPGHGRANRAADACEHRLDRFAARWRLVSSHAVHVANAGAAAGDGRCL